MHGRPQFTRSVRLWQDRPEAKRFRVSHGGGIGISAGNDRENGGIHFRELAHRFDSAETVFDREVADEEMKTGPFIHRFLVD